MHQCGILSVEVTETVLPGCSSGREAGEEARSQVRSNNVMMIYVIGRFSIVTNIRLIIYCTVLNCAYLKVSVQTHKLLSHQTIYQVTETVLTGCSSGREAGSQVRPWLVTM